MTGQRPAGRSRSSIEGWSPYEMCITTRPYSILLTDSRFETPLLINCSTSRLINRTVAACSSQYWCRDRVSVPKNVHPSSLWILSGGLNLVLVPWSCAFNGYLWCRQGDLACLWSAATLTVLQVSWLLLQSFLARVSFFKTRQKNLPFLLIKK
jgi:hypothetical protein